MEKPIFAVQVTNRDDEELHRTVKALEQAGCEWINFGLIPFTDDITNLHEFDLDRPVIPLAGTKILDMYMRGKLPNNWIPFYDQHGHRFNQEIYSRYSMNWHMVNYKATFVPFNLHQFNTYDRFMFVKPVDDRKAFPGFVLEPGKSIHDVLLEQSHGEISRHQRIAIGPLVEINREYRLFVVNDQVVAASEYRSCHGVKHKSVDQYTMKALIEFHSKFAILFKSEGEPYVVDVAETFDSAGMKYKIMEFQCFNCCGMYEADRVAVFKAVNSYVAHYLDKPKKESDA